MEVLSLKDRKNPADFEKNFRWLKTYLQEIIFSEVWEDASGDWDVN
ncbi:MAG: hypothetical protein AB9903_35435 [Vulcanimicrobiota bacterium]